MRPTFPLIVALALVPIPSYAQEYDSLGQGSAIGVTVGRFGIAEGGAAMITFHVSSLKPAALRPEFGVSIFPSAGLVTNIDLGPALDIGFSGATLLVRGGGSALMVLGDNGGGAIPGFHMGVSLLVRAGFNTAIRFEALHRIYFDHYENPSAFSLAVGISTLPKH